MQKISLEQSEWLWALNRGKLLEYYRSRYSDINELTQQVIGSFASRLFFYSDKLVSIAYKNLISDWSSNLHTTNLSQNNEYRETIPLSSSLFSYLLFMALKFAITVSELTEVIDGDWEAHWKELDSEFYVY